MIEPALIAETIGGTVPDRAFHQLGLVDDTRSETLTFLDDKRFASQLCANAAISGVILRPNLLPAIADREDLTPILHEDPRWAYYTLYNRVGERDYRRSPSIIAASASIHPTASISDINVTIGEGTIVGPNVSILPDVHIGKDCFIQAGAVIGSIGFEIKRTSQGLLNVFHDGEVIIEDGAQIGANAAIDKGFRNRPTRIGAGSRIDNLVHVAHSAAVGERALVIAGTVLGGSVAVGDDVWLSINSSVAPGIKIGDGAFVSIAAVVTRDVPDGEQVTGNFAVPHRTFLRMLKQGVSAAERID